VPAGTRVLKLKAGLLKLATCVMVAVGVVVPVIVGVWVGEAVWVPVSVLV
jgi:hypothetical protein